MKGQRHWANDDQILCNLDGSGLDVRVGLRDHTAACSPSGGFLGFLGLCSGDPVVDTLRDVFDANILRIPEERFQPLTVLAAHGETVSFRGALAPLIAGAAPAFPPVASSQI